MYVVIYNPETDEELHRAELEPDDVMSCDAEAFDFARRIGYNIATSDGYIPNCSGDFRVEFRENPDNGLVIWSGKSYYFAE